MYYRAKSFVLISNGHLSLFLNVFYPENFFKSLLILFPLNPSRLIHQQSGKSGKKEGKRWLKFLKKNLEIKNIYWDKVFPYSLIALNSLMRVFLSYNWVFKWTSPTWLVGLINSTNFLYCIPILILRIITIGIPHIFGLNVLFDIN